MQEIDIHRVPRPVCKAVNLLWLLLAIGVIRGIVFPSAPSAAIPGWLTIAIRILVVGSMCFFIWKVRAGRNWARKVQLALFCFYDDAAGRSGRLFAEVCSQIAALQVAGGHGTERASARPRRVRVVPAFHQLGQRLVRGEDRPDHRTAAALKRAGRIGFAWFAYTRSVFRRRAAQVRQGRPVHVADRHPRCGLDGA